MSTAHQANIPYPTYRDSGVDWLGEIPEHWEVERFKRIFCEKKHIQNNQLNSGAISFGEVVFKDDTKILESTKFSYQEVLVGEFLINPLNLNYDLVSLRIALSDINCVVSAGYIVIKNTVNIHKKYYKYLLHIYDITYMKLLGSGVRQTISFNHMANSLLPIPPLPEQQRIAAFLDNKTALIEKAIALKSQHIALLKERLQIIIQTTVTQGLNKTTPLKNTGVDWLGKIPEHWEVKKLKFFSDIKNGEDHKHVQIEDGYPVFGSGGKFANASQFLHDGEAVLLGRKGTIEKPLYVNEKFWTVDTMFYCVCNKTTSTKFIYYCATQIPFSYYATSTALPSMKQSDLLNHVIGLPPLPEQQQIADYLEQKSAETAQAIAVIERQLRLLQEYKTTLINASVTGKICLNPKEQS